METQLSKLLEDESEDAILARIQEESLRYFNEVELPRRAAEQSEKQKKNGFGPNESNDFQPGFGPNQSKGFQPGFGPNQSNDFQPKPHCSKQVDHGDVSSKPAPTSEVFYRAPGQGADGFHLAAGETYVYPTNYPVRQYQKTIIHSALFHNTLVSLPTGLGKTFIAAVVMYNFFRWFPQGKIVFMAPTRPLVAQQIRACHDIMAIPIKDTIEMTGAIHATDRLQHWKSKRVFFLTPQVMANDLRTKACPPSSGAAFKCVVIDEAHRATKEYSYCHVIKELETAGAIFRVVALSATPGSNIKAVVEVVQNLRISTLELRGEDSHDVTPYTHAKQVEPISLSLSKNITDFREQYLLIFERYARSLRDSRLITSNVQNLTKFQLLKASEKMRSRPPNGVSKARIGAMMSDFTVCMTLAHGLELLQTYGLRAFFQYFSGCEDEENRKAAFTRLNSDGDFQIFMNKLHKAVSSPMDQSWSHPKHERLVKILKEHFCQAEQLGTDTKVIIFCQYRVVVSELYELLQKTHPLIKPVMFIGQGSGKDKSGLPQKKQIEVMKGFRQGISNVLIATCVAEEGLDIGSVDLLVMMECQRSPVRLVQRLGRTGRHRQGRCVVLLTSGREVQKFNEAMATRKSFISIIQNSNLLQSSLMKDEPQMIPPHIMPKMQLVHINVPERITPAKKKKQADIRQALMKKINECDEKEPEQSPFLDPDQLADVEKELGGTNVKFDSLNCRNTEYLFNRINDPPMQPDELFSAKFTQHSEYNDWNRVLHQTYLVLHSSDTETLCHLLHKSESMLLNTHTDLNSQQINSSSLFPQKKEAKKNINKNDNLVKKNKKEKEEKHGRDIRECMARVAEKVKLTQNKVGGENESASQNINADEEIIDTFPDPVVLELSDTLPVEVIKEIKNISNEEVKEFDCIFCDKASAFSKKYFFINKSSINNDLLRLHLRESESLVKTLSKETIKNINVAEMFSEESNIVNTIKNSMTRLKTQLNHHVGKRINSPLISVDDIFDNDLNSTPSPILGSNVIYSQIPPDEDKTNKPNSNTSDEDFFNLEDLFNDDDVGFQALATKTKTSTPIKINYPYKNGSINKSSNSISALSISEKFQNNDGHKDPTSNKNNVLINNSDLFSPIQNLNNHVKPIFKIPQMKMKSGVLSSPQLNSNINKCVTPVSPILSGQKTINPNSSFSPILSSQVASRQDSILSPVLSGQVSGKEQNLSPILSGQITSTPKIERKVLFKDNSNKAGEMETSVLCRPLEAPEKYSDADMAEIEALNMFSASQLFDDSSEEEKEENLDQSSMYTISQMVAKVSALADKIKNSTPAEEIISTSKIKSPRNVGLEDSDEDFIFDQINLDNISVQKDSAQEQFNRKCNFASSSKTIEKNSKLKNGLNDSLAIEMNEIEKSKMLKKTNLSTSRSSEADYKSKSAKREFSQRNDESFISSRWLTCMKTPLKTNKSVSFADKTKTFSCDSDSDSDVFEGPPNKNTAKTTNVKPTNKKGKSKKQNVKAQFLELEADVSMTGGVRCSSDEENTSGLDELDASFINDMTEVACTSVDQTAVDIQARYLQSVKSPMRRPGFKIPTLTDSVLERDVFSQADPEYDDNSYENDSFCCDATQIPVEDEPSVLEIAERLLKQKRKAKKRKRKLRKSESSSDEPNKSIIKVFKNKRLLSSSSSSEDLTREEQRIKKRKRLSSSESSPSKAHSTKVKKIKRVQLLTSSDSDSDRTVL